ncbi:hypothetical protein [Azospirillum agricola]|uniref:hypothetical protein n=1 Tax=Azospirillum agricola TaxID=1720247 RepID=UPI000A0EFB99|nr:hypothetical protein [Azospirillum agricola]MBP2232115.1 hypothetical protein [Azospirillum agricola]SMH44886.1 hypothetical protein SAMN02982994_2153 [Azospirillum lipoferum]
MSGSVSGVKQMVSDLNKSLNAAIAAAQEAAAPAAATGDVKSYEKTVRKSSSDSRMFATDIGVLSKNVSRLNVVGTLAPNDNVDFYKFRVTTKGEATIGQVGDPGMQIQVMSKTGQVVADSNEKAGKAYDSFRSLQRGELTLDRGDYTVRVSRAKGESAREQKNYALQFTMGSSYSQDYDTIAKEPRKGDSPFQLSDNQQKMLDGLNQAISNMNSIPSGQTGTQKLMGSFNLFV